MSISQVMLCNQYGHLDKIHFLSDLPLEYRGDNSLVYRYMQYPDFKLSLANRNFAFVSPKNWEDQLEQRFWKTDYSLLNPNFRHPEFACLCVTPENLDDSAASWKMYRREPHEVKSGDYDNNLVRLTFCFKTFLESLNIWASKKNSEIYFIAIDYSHGQEEIKNELPKDPHYFPKGFDIEDYFKVLALKRPNYSFEREIRIFVIEPKSGSKIQDSGLLLLDEFDLAKCITKILVAPAKNKYEKKLTAEIVRSEIKGFFDGKNLSNFVNDCRQFEPQKCKKIEPQKLENRNMDNLFKNSKFKIECTIEELAVCEDKYKIKIKGTSPYLQKDGSSVNNMFECKSDVQKNVPAMREIKMLDAKQYLGITVNEKIERLLYFAFENKKVVVIGLEELKSDCLTINAISVKH